MLLTKSFRKLVLKIGLVKPHLFFNTKKTIKDTLSGI